MKTCPLRRVKNQKGEFIKRPCAKEYVGSCPYDEQGKCMGKKKE